MAFRHLRPKKENISDFPLGDWKSHSSYVAGIFNHAVKCLFSPGKPAGPGRQPGTASGRPETTVDSGKAVIYSSLKIEQARA
jgi:hypothetical protein